MFKTKENNYKSIIKECYNLCPRTQELHNDFSGYTTKECIEDMIIKLNGVDKLNFYSINNNKDLMGYFATCKIEDTDFLYTFFIKPEYRNKEILTKYWNIIYNTFSKDFISAVFYSNKPAIRFLRKNSKKESRNANTIGFLFTKEKVCL